MSRHHRVPTWAVLVFTGTDLLAWALGGPALRSWSMTSAAFVLSALGIWEISRRIGKEPEWRRAWLLVGAFLSLICLNSCLFGYQEFTATLGSTNLSPRALVQWMVAFVLLCFASLAFRSKRGKGWIEFLDGGIFATALYLCLWVWFIRELLAEIPGDPLQRVTLQITFLLLSITVGVAVHVWARMGFPMRHPQGLLAIGSFSLLLASIWRLQVDLSGGFTPAHPVRLAFIPAVFLLWLACRQPFPAERSTRRHLALLFALPYLTAALAFPFALIAYLPEGSNRDATGFILMGALSLLLLLRQAIAVRQVDLMNQSLEQKVQERTQALARSQAVVSRTQQMNLLATLGAGVIHDLNNLLTSTIGYLDMGREDVRTLPDQAEANLERAQNALTMASGLSRRIMALGRGEREEPQLLDLGLHIAQFEPVLRAILPKTLNLIVEPGRGSSHLVMAGQAYLDQILVNLVMNARDATPPGGTIWVRAWREGETAVLEVEDSGSGIPEHLLGRIFEPFFTTKAAGEGTGLGLGSIRAVVEQLQGDLSVDSEVGRGSRFTIRFPGVDSEGSRSA